MATAKAAKSTKAKKATKATRGPRRRKVHPTADLFPMLADDELAELAEDIKANGLLHPIVLDGEGRVLDGRNRLAACALAGVEAEFTEYTGDAPDQYALSVNLARRHLTKGQRAMIAARARLISSRSLSASAGDAGVSKGRVNQAAVVLAHAPDLADAVVSGAHSLDAAYAEARERKAAMRSEERGLDDLRERAPDLADQVVEGDLTLSEAVAAQQQRQADHEGAIRREVARLDSLLIGWPAMEALPENPDREEILASLSAADRKTIEGVEALTFRGRDAEAQAEAA